LQQNEQRIDEQRITTPSPTNPRTFNAGGSSKVPRGGHPIEDETEIERITDALRRAYPPRSQDNEPKASPGPETEAEMEKRVAGMYGFDIEAERRREAGFKEEIRRRGTIAALSFRQAKTMPEAPHEYVVRTPENEAAYVALFNLIIEQGVTEKWGRSQVSVLVPW
jgi:hypothetical protein